MATRMSQADEFSFQYTEPIGSKKGKFHAWNFIEIDQYILNVLRHIFKMLYTSILKWAIEHVHTEFRFPF